MTLRFISSVILVASMLFLPFWVTAVLFAFCCIYFEKFYLGLVVMLFVDIAHGYGGQIFYTHGMIFALAVILFLLAGFVRKTFIVKV